VLVVEHGKRNRQSKKVKPPEESGGNMGPHGGHNNASTSLERAKNPIARCKNTTSTGGPHATPTESKEGKKRGTSNSPPAMKMATYRE
jgi:hypothetical protein